MIVRLTQFAGEKFNDIGGFIYQILSFVRWQRQVEEVVKLPEFHDRNDFEVNLHPFLEKTDIPRDSQGRTDYTYMSTDCFHLSQKGHARSANAYYNSMLTPEKQRARSWSNEFESFRCPTPQRPFLLTTKNS